jgi:hypothetical protein
MSADVMLTLRNSIYQDEWTGQQLLKYNDVAEDIVPESIRPMGNYAVAISWPDGLTQVSINSAFSRRQPEQPQILD